MSEDNPPSLPPRSMIRQHIPGHSEHASGLPQHDLQLWQQISQPQQAAGVAMPVGVGIGFSSRPQQQVWTDHSSTFSQRGWQPFPQAHTQQSPQEPQDINPQVVRSQQQNWPGEMNQLQLQQLQQLIWLQQQQQQQQQHQLQLQQQHPTEQNLHHLEPIGHGHREEQSHEKFTKSPSPQIEDNRNSPAVGRPFMHNVTSPQQQLWQQHPQVQHPMHQYDMQHGEPQHSQAYQPTPVSHHQPLFAQQQYVQPAVWQHSPYSQVQVQHLRQSTPPIQQHVIWHQQQQQQLQQHQMQQQQHQQQQQQQHHSEPPPPYSPPSNSFLEKSPVKKDMENRNEGVSLFNNNKLPTEPTISKNEKKIDTMVSSVNNVGLGPTAPPLSLTPSISDPPKQIRILSKSSVINDDKSAFSSQTSTARTQESSFPTSTTPAHQRPIQGTPATSSSVRPQNFNPNPQINPYQNLNPQSVINKNLQELYGSQNALRAMKDGVYGQGHGIHQFRPRSPGSITRNPPPHQHMANNVFQRNAPVPPSNFHRVENVEVNIFIQGLNPRTRTDSIRNYMEIVGRPAAVKDHILFNLEHTEALVTFQHRPDMVKLRQNVKARKLDGFSLEICEMPPARGIVVTSETPIRSREALIYYFERDSVGGGALRKNGEKETEDGCCLLEFEDFKVVQRICTPHRQHRVDGSLLRVSPYYQCENGAIWDMNLHVVPVPKPVNIQILPDQLEFVKKHCQPQFAARLHDKYADISFSKDHVTVKSILRQNMPNYRTLVRGWETGVQEAVAKFLAGNIDQSDLGVPDIIWEKVTEFVNSGKPEFKDLLVKQDRERKSIKFVGFKSNVKNASQVLSDKIEVLSREARRKTETRKVKSVEKLTVLQIQGTFDDLSKKYGDMKISVDGNNVTVEGDPADISNAFIEMYTECDKVSPVAYEHSKTREWVSFARKDTTSKHIQKKLDQKQIKGSWEVTGTCLNIYVPKDSKSDGIKDAILGAVLEESIPVDKSSTDLLNSEVWGDFLKDNRRKFRDKVDVFTKKLQAVIIVGTDDVVPHISKLIKEFLDSKAAKTVTVQCDPVVLEFISECWTEDDYNEVQKNDIVIKKKASGIELTGLTENLIKGKQKLDQKLKRMCSKKHQLRRVGIHSVLEASKQSGTISAIEKDCRCVIKLPQDIDASINAMFSDFEVIDTDTREDDFVVGTSSNSTAKYFQTKKLKIKTQVVLGEIGHQKADIIVSSASSNLNLRSGSASYSLVKQGGALLQSECSRLYPNGIQDGEVAVIDSGSLNCDKVYLTSLPSWKDAGINGGKVFRKFMRECLRLADLHSKKTIAISAIGTGGYLGYPREVAASIMYGAVVEFDTSYSKTSLKEISFVIYNKDTETIKAFEDHEHMRIHGSASLGSLSSDFLDGRIKIELVTDELSKQKVDALLCSVSSDMSLTRSAICKSLVQDGGPSLQNECKQKYKNELSVGKVVDISAGKLPCKTIFLTVLPTYSEASAEQSLISTLQTVFQLANLKGYKSLAIPALGTGYLNYPKTIAAKCMYDAVLDWATKNTKASLKTVRFVMYSKDNECQQAYRLCHMKSEGRESRLRRQFLGDTTILARSSDTAKYKMVKDGCQIGCIQLNVVVGDILSNKADVVAISVGANFDMKGALAQALVKKCPNILPECQQKKTELKKDGVVLTKSAGLTATYVLHILNQDSLSGWRSKMTTGLEEANKKQVKSVAFPLLGTARPDSFVECLFAAIDDFGSQNGDKTIKEVRLVVDHNNVTSVQSIMSALQGKTNAATSKSELSKLLNAGKGYLADAFGKNVKQSESGKNAKANNSVTVTVHSDAIINIDKCIKTLDDNIGLEYTKKSVDVDVEVIKKLTDSQINGVVDQNILVDVKCDKKAGTFIISGPQRNVLAAMDCVLNKLRQYDFAERNDSAATVLYSQIKWHWLREDRAASDSEEIPYDMKTNYVIESAFKEGKSNVELVDGVSRTYIVDFQKLIEHPKNNLRDSVRIVRKDILQGLKGSLPSSWMSMSNNENIKRVALNSCSEYQKIEKLFLGQVRNGVYASKVKNNRNVQVLKIERIQNRTLYQQYSAKKKLMEQQNKSGSKQVERQLWHGTMDNNVAGIINNGFNRSYCGVNGVLYGQGVYFAGDASYSAQAYLTGSKPGTKRFMFVVKALTGEFVKGNPSLRVLPPLKSSQPTVLYDSAVDDINNPMEFVIFHDTQAYPEYLITYSS
ncbi:Poly (ADP-ribose) polymerase [Mactra antiquata]